jgi:hypothetical protein
MAGKNTKSTSKEAKIDTGSGIHYEEWNCKVILTPDGKDRDDKEKFKREFKKLELVRDFVNIREEEAEVLNTGVLNGPANVYVLAYFKAEGKGKKTDATEPVEPVDPMA